MILDPMYFVFVGPAFLLALLAQVWVKSAYNRTARIAASSGMTGAEAAARMLHAARVPGARIESIEGVMSDHYDPRDRTLRLSRDVYHGRSIAAVGIACHEAGHAIQHARAYAPLVIRNAAVPAANFGGGAGGLLFFLGLVLGMAGLAMLGMILFGGVVVFQLINLPVEFDASARAKRALADLGVIGSSAEKAEVNRVLNAAAMTYVAGTLTSIATLLYYAFRLGLFGSRSE